ncbi:MAG: hypothetical protein Q9214_004628, partial [Letrouitia sp. 1 TL-2023]
MAEAVSLISSIIAIQKLTGTVIGYLNEVSGAVEERQRILAEIVDTTGLLYMLKDTEEQAKQHDLSTAALASLSGPDGALQKFREALENLACKLRPASGLRKASKALIWPFQKSEIRDILNRMERQKSSFALALQSDHFSVIIDFLESEWSSSRGDTIGIAFLYCSYQDTEQTACNLIGCLTKQLVNRIETIPLSVRELYKQHSMRRTRPSSSEMLEVLIDVTSEFDEVFIMVDALDECSEHNDTRSTLLRSFEQLSFEVHLLVTSRPIASIRNELHPHEELSIAAQLDDIRLYVESKIESKRRLRNYVRDDPRLKEAIIQAISRSARGMFLLVQLHLSLLSQKLNLEDVYDNLIKLPNAIEATYDEAVRRIADGGPEEEELASRIIMWILHTLRPLEVAEIRQALAITRDATFLTPSAMVDEETLLSVCGGLVVFDEKTGHVRLIHYTTQEYFEKRQDATKAHSYITGICLTYLLSANVASVLEDETAQSDDQVKQLPFLMYSRSQWGSHYHLCDGVGVEDLAVKLLEDQTRVLKLSKYDSWTSAFGRTLTRGFVGLHIAALFNLPGLLRKLAAAFQPDINVKSMKGWTPLAIACSQRYTEIVRSLLARDDLDINAGHGTAYGTALHGAAASGDIYLARKLLIKGIGLDLTTSRGYTALHTAAESGHVDVANLLIKRGCNPISRTNTGANALYLAIRSGSQETFIELIQLYVNINITTFDLWTPLHEAVLCNEKAMVKELLNRGASITQETDNGLTALNLA